MERKEKEEKQWIEFKNPKTGKNVGYTTEKEGRGTYITERNKPHYFRKFSGFGVSEDVLNLLKGKGIEDIWMGYKPTKEVFTTTVREIENCDGWDNIEGDKQKVMPLHRFEKPLGKGIFQKIVEALKRYTYLKEDEYHLLALWIMHTYCVEDFGVTPYIQLIGQPGSGKSTVMRLCSMLVKNGKKGSFSAASIFRMVKSPLPTLCFNEFEKQLEDPIMVEVLNNGYEAGEMIARVDLQGGVTEFSPFCAKMFAIVNKETKTTFDSRSIQIRTMKSPKELEPLTGKNPSRDKELLELQQAISSYTNNNREFIMELFWNLKIALINRPGQIMKTLATIENYLGLPEHVVNTYKEKAETQLKKDLRMDKALIVLRVLYKHDGKMSLKQLTQGYNEQRGSDDREQYVAGILRNLNLEEYVRRTAEGNVVNVPMGHILAIFEGRNITKELLDKVVGNSSVDNVANVDTGESDSVANVEDVAEEVSHGEQEAQGDNSYLFEAIGV